MGSIYTEKEHLNEIQSILGYPPISLNEELKKFSGLCFHSTEEEFELDELPVSSKEHPPDGYNVQADRIEDIHMDCDIYDLFVLILTMENIYDPLWLF